MKHSNIELVYEKEGYRGYAIIDECPTNPADDWDLLGSFAVKKNCKYEICKQQIELPSDLTIEKEVVVEYIDGEQTEWEEVDVGMDEYMRHHHEAWMVIPIRISQNEMRETNEDRANACIYITRAKFVSEYGEDVNDEKIKIAHDVLLGEMKLLDNYANGEVYGFKVFEPTDDGEEPIDEYSDVDACWGYYGSDHKESGLLEAVTESINYRVAGRHEEDAQALTFPAWKFIAYLNKAQGITFK